MKKCPKCGQTYTDSAINFCLNDGELLSYLADDAPRTIFQNEPPSFIDDWPPTEFLDRARVTSETNWPPQAAPVLYQSPQQGLPLETLSPYPTSISPNQTLAIVSLGLGVGSMTVGWCCSMGLVLAPAAMIIGFISLSQIKNNPQTNGGRGFAIGGIVAASVFLACYLLYLLFIILMALLS